MSFVNLGDFYQQHFLRAPHVTGANKKARDLKERESNRVMLIMIIDNLVFFYYLVQCL